MPLPPNNAGYQVPLNVVLNPTALNNSAKQVQRALGRITGQASEFQKSLDASTARVFAFGTTTAVLTGVTTAFKLLVSTTIDVEKKLIDLKSILGGTASDFNEFREVIFDVAKATGQTFAITADAAGELARQGLSATETAKRLKDALILTNTSGLDSVKSVNALTAAINGFTSAGLTSTQIVNKLTAVDRAFAVSAKDLAEAFQRTGSSAEDAGVSFDELLGLITSVQQRTSRGGAVIGNALKSIFTRVSRGETIEKLQALGVAIDANQSGVQKLNALSNALQNISDPTTANAIKELAGGVYQINIVSAALKDLGDANSIFTGATLKSAQATNEAYKANDELQKSIAAQLNGLIQGMANLAEKIGQLTFAPLLKDLISLSTGLAEGISKALDPEKGNALIKGFFNTIGAFLSGPAVLLFSVAFAKIFKLVAGFAKEGFKTVLGIGSQAEKIKSISEGINKVLSHNVGLQQQMVSGTLTEAQKRAAIFSAIQNENQALLAQQKILTDIAKTAFSAGVRGFQGEVFVGQKGKPIAAAGFVPNFSMGQMLERQGAREHGYQAGRVKQTRIHDGNGKSFNSFVNSREKITTFTNAAGKKATIVQPPNGFGKGTQFAKGVNASGFVPSFADESFGYLSALRNLAKLSPAQLAQKLSAPRSTPDEKMAAKFLLEQKQGGNFDSRAFIRDLDAKRSAGRAMSSVPAIVGGIDLNKPNIAEGMAATFVAKGINSNEELEKYRIAGTKSFKIDGKTIYESEANNLLGRTRKANVTAAGEKRKREIERGYEEYNINADALGGILLVSPRFGLNGPRASASLNAYDIPSLYGMKNSDGTDLFDKTKDKNSQRAKISVKGIQTTGVPQQGKDVLGISKDINELMAGPIVGLAGRMYGDLFNIGDRQEFSNKLAGFKSSASGGLLSAAAEGSIFEAASKVALSSMKEMPAVFDPAGDQRPFDFSNAGAMKRIFGVNTQRGEAKRLGTTGYQGQIDGIVKKVFNDPEYSQKALSSFLSQKMGNAAGGFIPNFAAFTKSRGASTKKYSTESGSYISVKPNAKKKQIAIDFIKSQKKGDAFSLFSHVARMAKRSKSSIFSDELIPQGESQIDPFSGLEGSNWSKLLKIYPQLRYRNLPKSITSGNFQYKNALKGDYSQGKFKNLQDLENTINSFSQEEFVKSFSDSNIYNLKTKMLGGGFIPNFASGFLQKGYVFPDGKIFNAGDHADAWDDIPSSLDSRQAMKYASSGGRVILQGKLNKSISNAFSKFGVSPDKIRYGSIDDEMRVENEQAIGKKIQEISNSFVSVGGGYKARLRSYKGSNLYSHVQTPQGDLYEIMGGIEPQHLGMYGGFESFLAKNQSTIKKIAKSEASQLQNSFNGPEAFFSAGFVPNFSAVKDAISREKSFGLSSSQIYVDKNSALKSSQNPLGLGVFNTRDEPMGARQGINRAKSEGRNPKTYGMAAGFIPNFAPQKNNPVGDVKRLEFQKSLDFLFESFKDGNIKLKDLVSTVKAMGREMGLTGDEAKKLRDEVQKAAFDFANFKGGIKTGFGQAARLPSFEQQGRRISVDSKFGGPAIPRANFAPQFSTTLSSTRSGGLSNRERKTASQLGFEFQSTLVNRDRSKNKNKRSFIASQIEDVRNKRGKLATGFSSSKESLSKETGIFKKLEGATLKLQGGLLSASFAVNTLLGDFPELQNGLNIAITSLSTLSLLAPMFPTIVAGFTSIIGAVGAASLALAALPVAIAGVAAYLTYNAAKEGVASEEAAQASIEAESRQRAKKITVSRTAKEAGITDLDLFNREIKAFTDKGGSIKKLQKDLFEAYDSNDEQKIEEARKKLLEAFVDGAKAIDPYNMAVSKLKESSLSLANSFISTSAKINSNIDKFLLKLEKQSIAESIASNVSVRSDAPFENGVKNLLKIRSDRTGASQASASFFKSFTDTGGIAELIKSRVAKDQVFAASGGQSAINQKISSGEFQQESFLSYIKDGAEGLKSKIEEAIGPLQGNEAGEKFFETIKNAAQDFRDKTIEGYQSAKNIQSQLENDLVSNRIEFVKAIQTAITDLPSSIADISSGPKVDPLSLFKKFEEAAKLLNSGKKGDAVKGAAILNSTSEEASRFKKIFREEGLLDLQTRAGLSLPDISKARGAASVSQLDFSKIEESIRKNLSGNDLAKSIKALQDAQADPSKIKTLIDTIGQTFSPQRLQKEGSQITKSLTGVSTASFEDEALKGLNEKQIKISKELDAVSQQVLAFGQAFAGTTITESVNKLDLAVRKASENLSDFTTFTTQLSDLSKNIGPRLNAIEAKLNQLGN